jgi:integrase
MARSALSDRFIESDKRKPQRGRVDYGDSLVPGLALRVTSAGHKSFVLIARYPLNPKNPTRRALGDHGELTLDGAREKARAWLALIQKGIDPKIEEARKRAEAMRRQTNTFGAVAAEFIDQYVIGPATVELERQAKQARSEDPHLAEAESLAMIRALPKNRALVKQSEGEGIEKRDDAENTINTEFVKRWGTRPVTDILPEECAAAIRAIVKRGAPYQAHNAFGYLRRLFNWAIGRHEFGITVSPLERLSPKDLIGKREARERILTDTELTAVWDATGGRVDAAILAESRRRDRLADKTAPIGYPYGPLFRMLILTGQREREVADMTWSEVDLAGKLWTIPASRMKGGRTHQVPLAPDALALLKSLPRFTAGDFVFTTTAGAKPVNGFSKAKVRLDRLSGVDAWKLHDLRRTVRTHFSALPVQDNVRELTIAHAKQGLHKVYDLHAYRAEKLECLTLWEARLRGIVVPAPDNVVTLKPREVALEGAA